MCSLDFKASQQYIIVLYEKKSMTDREKYSDFKHYYSAGKILNVVTVHQN